MDEKHTPVTIKRIEKIPSQFYLQVPQPKTMAHTKVMVEITDSLWAERKRLTNILHLKPTIGFDFSGSVSAWAKNWFLKAKVSLKSAGYAAACLLRENAKRLAFSGTVSCCVALMAGLILFMTCSLGYKVTVNGQNIGVLQSAKAYDRLVEEVNKEIAYVSDQVFLPEESEVALCLIPKHRYSDETDVKELLKSTRADMLPAYAVYANEEILFALPNEQTALAVLEEYKNKFTNGNKEIKAEFCENVLVARRFVPKSALKTADSAASALASGRRITHHLSEEDTIDTVAASYGVTVEEIMKTNFLTSTKGANIQTLTIQTETPLLSVKTTELKTLEEEIPFNTIENPDPAHYEGTQIVEQEGAPGSRVIEAYITTVNGVETERQVVSESTLAQAVDKIVKKGTKALPSPIGSGVLSLPANGSLSSRFGSRWGRNHNGIDLAASTGTNIYAADNGTVIYSQYNDGGYGYLIQIDHGNGIVTYYGHCSELLVPEGAIVGKGDLIAKVGNTGRSTGSHLHFEVRINGNPTDPMAYLDELKK